jgi:ABC-type transport system involved in cytochrome c biogenesis permease subunit
MLAVGLAVHHLRGAPPVGRLKAFLPPAEDADLYIYRFTLLGFIFLTIMIISGSIWANSAWGSYWSWDPIEVWSLIAWLISATELHLIRTYNWHGRQLAWVSVLALAVVVCGFRVGHHLSEYSPILHGKIGYRSFRPEQTTVIKSTCNPSMASV